MSSAKNRTQLHISGNKHVSFQPISGFFKSQDRSFLKPGLFQQAILLKPGLKKLSFLFVVLCFVFEPALASQSEDDQEIIIKTCNEEEGNLLKKDRTCLTLEEKQEVVEKLYKQIGENQRQAEDVLQEKRKESQEFENLMKNTSWRTNIKRELTNVTNEKIKNERSIRTIQAKKNQCRTDFCPNSFLNSWNSRIDKLNKDLLRLKKKSDELGEKWKGFSKKEEEAHTRYPTVKWEWKTAREIYNNLSEPVVQNEQTTRTGTTDSAPAVDRRSRPANPPKQTYTSEGMEMLTASSNLGIVETLEEGSNSAVTSHKSTAVSIDAEVSGVDTIITEGNPLTASDAPRNDTSPPPFAIISGNETVTGSGTVQVKNPNPFRSAWNWLTGKTTPEGKPISYAGTSTGGSAESSTEENPNPFRSAWNWLTGKTTPDGTATSTAGTTPESSPGSPPEEKPGPFRSAWNWLTGKTTPEGKPISYAGTSTGGSAESSTEENPNPFRSAWNWLTGKSTSTAGSAADGKTGTALVGAVAATAGVTAFVAASRRDTASGNAVVGESTTNVAFPTGETIDIVSKDCRILTQRKAILGKRWREYDDITDEYKKIYEKLQAAKDKEIEAIKKKLNELLERQKQALFDVVNIDLDTKEGEKLPIASQVVRNFSSECKQRLMICAYKPELQII